MKVEYLQTFIKEEAGGDKGLGQYYYYTVIRSYVSINTEIQYIIYYGQAVLLTLITYNYNQPCSSDAPIIIKL